MSFGAFLKGAGGFIEAKEQRRQGNKSAQRGREQRALDEVYAGQIVAIGQMKSFEQKRLAKLMASRAIAVAAAGGASQDIDNLIADIEGEGVYRASLAMYEAEADAERLRFRGLMAERTGREIQSTAYRRSRSTLISGFGSMVSG